MRAIESDLFNCTDGERAAFEAGIKLGSLYHQFIGVPVRPESRKDLERSMTAAVMSQPHVVDAKVTIDEEVLRESLTRFGYCSLKDRMMAAEVTIRVNETCCRARMDWIEELGYPLMRIESIGKE